MSKHFATITSATAEAILRSQARVTPITDEGVGHPSLLSHKGWEEHCKNFNHPRRAQAINRQRKAKGLPALRPGERY